MEPKERQLGYTHDWAHFNVIAYGGEFNQEYKLDIVAILTRT